MMPCLHNYVTVDPKAFLSDPKYCEVIFNMSKKMLIDYSGEGAQCQAAKLLEVIVLQYRGEIDQWLPVFVSLCLDRLSVEVKTSELRVMLIQVIITCLINNPLLVLSFLEKPTPTTPQGVTSQFLAMWLKDTDCFLGMHDRKVYILGICTLLSLPAEQRPVSVNVFAAQFLPALMLVFDGLNGLYAKMEDGDDEVEEVEEEEELNDSDDEYDEEGQKYIEMLKKKEQQVFDFDDDWTNELDLFTTPIDDNPYIDEYITFKGTFEALQSIDNQLFVIMTSVLNEQQRNAVQEVINHGILRQQKLESRKIEAQGGYTFQVTNIPNNFSFGGSLS